MKGIFKILFFISIFLGGLYFYTIYNNTKEGLTNINGEPRCPNLLIQKEAKFYLYNSNIAEVPGVNPIEFNNLEDYVEFLEWQRSAGIICPVLYLQNTYDAQGNRVYKVRPSVTELQGGLPPAAFPGEFTSSSKIPVYLGNIEMDELPYQSPALSNSNINPVINQNSIPVVTANELTKSNIDPNANTDNLLYSPDAMDSNWGGVEYTEQLVDAGYYKGNETNIYVP
jgi:hypothetical protein